MTLAYLYILAKSGTEPDRLPSNRKCPCSELGTPSCELGTSASELGMLAAELRKPSVLLEDCGSELGISPS